MKYFEQLKKMFDNQSLIAKVFKKIKESKPNTKIILINFALFVLILI